ncbi:hypothetical protein C0Q70_03725 [Pomacea canaliculata]|uniref:Sulfotransferase domain-containing protein n=1 Tax=Pomacea canaliculata TaxID=400727 RepID=A0A2T7PTN1_POMCA|nr:sulfotransferase family cytosolic 1B member 1-like [Pomacea canaliculata]XP_025084364.1 sulfotransferase family cytosolic 1B member 1-like [Pomacea canaliculata]XP_025084365.1 sulfotransferase family cytosolic 1B member 1-like [Pomacea canaliculata]XP_025084366.1 sulfotransferase family cytosolic 1B member 1-like [Pomacea canaliculata]PVD36737.1 hypothetical protein C0Q70_03725 [Pomacea canaliculata]
MPLVRLPDAGGNTILLMKYGPHGYLGIPDATEEHQSMVHTTPLRPDDVLLCSYPKTGCHWLWEIARMLLAGTTQIECTEKEKCMLEFASREAVESVPSPRVLNTHFLFNQLPQEVHKGQNKILFIYRNPKDVAVSFYNHHVKFPEYEYSGKFSDYLTLFLNGHLDSGSMFTYMRDWEAVINSNPDLPIFVVSYEDLQEDTLEKTKELARFLESTASEEVVKEIVAKCSFNSMKERKGQQWTETFGEAVMYRKGKVGDWKTWFTVAESQMFDAVCEKEMPGTKFNFRYTF